MQNGQAKDKASYFRVFAGIMAMGWVARNYQTAWWVRFAALAVTTRVSFRLALTHW